MYALLLCPKVDNISGSKSIYIMINQTLKKDCISSTMTTNGIIYYMVKFQKLLHILL